MRTDQAIVIRRADYSPPRWRITQVHLEFVLDPHATLVTSTLHLERAEGAAGADDALQLAGDSLALVDLQRDGQPFPAQHYDVTPQALVIRGLPSPCVLQIRTRLDPTENSSLMGLYVSNGNYFTQCEAEGFRRITYFLDRPDVMARYTVKLLAPRAQCPVLLSNGNLVASGPCGEDRPGWHWASWEDPFPKPSYLFALVAGNLSVREQTLRTASGREVLLQVWVEPGNENKTEHALGSLVRAIRWDEARFGLELDLDRFMIVAVSDFNMGAMENKGLNIFNTKYVFANPAMATDVDFGNVESVVGHEYFHNWTGNRVTCRDWFQLTLKEGLTVFRDQEFSADVLAAEADSEQAAASARAVKRIDDVRVLRSAQFPEDAGPMAHPIRPDSYQEINNFYTVTVYEKGAEVIRMMQTLVGRVGFRRGMDLYFQRHDGQAVTCDDFVAAIADANARDLTQFRRWYAQAGTPQVSVSARHDPRARRYELTLEQSCPATPGQPEKLPFHIPFAVGLIGPDGQALPLLLAGSTEATQAGQPTTAVLDFTGQRQTFVFEDVALAPVPSLNRNFSAPVNVEFAWSPTDLSFLARHDDDPFNRWEAAQRLVVASVLNVLDGAEVKSTCRQLVDTFALILQDLTLDAAYKEQLFTLPAEGFIAEHLAVVDPVALRQARLRVRGELAHALATQWREIWSRLHSPQPYRPDAASAARRALRNVALSYWVATEDPQAHAAAAAQFDEADNMTERLAAVQTLVNSAAPQRQSVLDRFGREFADEPLVMDKWFMLQATRHRQGDEPPVIGDVKILMAHPAFSLKNPNKVRALIGSFVNGNLAEFHAADGAGYRFWAEQIVAIDGINAQVAARLARALDRWRKFTPDRQALMREALETVARHEGLSADVAEIVGKALDS